MNYEKPPLNERIGTSRGKLLAMEKEGKFVFHGSTEIVGVLEPNQATNNNEETGVVEKDGEPAVFATPYADVAIFRALINTKGAAGDSTSRFGIDGKRLHFSATDNLLEQANNKKGMVYVLNKNQFKNFEGTQCRSSNKIIPIEAVEVTAEDLPENIDLIK